MNTGFTTTVNRRFALKAAVGAIVATPGCSLLEAPEEKSGSAPKEKPASEKPAAPEEATRRLFTIYVKGGTKVEDRGDINARWHELSTAVTQSGDVLRQWNPGTVGEEPQFIAWLKPTTAAMLRKNPQVERVEARKPGDPVKSTIGPLRQQLTEPPSDGKRNLIVLLGQNSWSSSPNMKSPQTTAEIAKKWTEQLKSVEGLSISVVKAAKWSEINGAGFHIGPNPGQIRITVEGDTVPEEALKIIQSHPQTERLQWDHAEVIYNCPPCGMG